MLKESNNADQKLIVGSLEVLSDIKNRGLNIIKSTVDELQNAQKTEQKKTADYYAAMAEDGVITPIEKKTLKSELNTIERTHAAILADAEKNKCTNIAEIKNYENVFGYLLTYLYSNLKMFDNPSENTEIDKTEFNRVFSDYYTAEAAAISSIDRKESHDYATQEDIKHHTATYLGAISELPKTLHSDYGIGDWFTWSVATQGCENASNGKLIKGHIYKQIFIDDTTYWQEVNPAEKDAQGFNVHSQEIMTALNDILSLNDAKDGYFYNVFASSFFAASAVIESLKVHFLRVVDHGILQTENYKPTEQGWIITDEQGAKQKNLKYPVEFMCPLHIGNKTDKSSVIDGNVLFQGDVKYVGDNVSIGDIFISNKALECLGKPITDFPQIRGSANYSLNWEYDCDPKRSYYTKEGKRVYVKKMKMISDSYHRSDNAGTRASKGMDWYLYAISANGNSYYLVEHWDSGYEWTYQGFHGSTSWNLYYPRKTIKPVLIWSAIPQLSDFSKRNYPKGIVYRNDSGNLCVY